MFGKKNIVNKNGRKSKKDNIKGEGGKPSSPCEKLLLT